MDDIKVINKNGLYGVEEGGKIVVPVDHISKVGAISEWVYFEKANTEVQFLDHVRTLEEIFKIKSNLQRQDKKV